MTAPAVELVEDRGDVLLRIRAAPGKRQDRIVGVHGGALKVAVAAPPERGRANRQLLAVLAKELGLPPGSLTLESGEAARDKRVRIAGTSVAELRRALVQCLGS